MTDQLEKLIEYLNRKNRESKRTDTLTPKEVILYYEEMKAINSEKAVTRTLNYIDNYLKEFGK